MNVQTSRELHAPAIGELNAIELEAVAGGHGGVTYYQMGGNWYIVGHDKQGHATGAVLIGPV